MTFDKISFYKQEKGTECELDLRENNLLIDSPATASVRNYPT